MESHSRYLDLGTSRWHDTAYWVLLIVLGAAFLVMNFLTTLKEDDMLFTLIEGELTPVHTLTDALRSYGYHYLHTNGRLADIVPLFFCGIAGKTAFNICNTLVFTMLLHMLSLLVTGHRSVLTVSLFAAVIGTCYPVPGETMLWIAGSAGYMWAVTCSLVLVYYLQLHHQSPIGWGGAIALLLGAFVTGGFNEATSFGFFAGLCAYYACNRDRFDRRAAIALVGYLLGIVLIASSPGAWNRVAAGGIAVDMPPCDLLKSRLFIFHEKMWRFLTPVAALIVGVAALAFRHSSEVRRCVWIYITVALAVVMFVLGIIHERAYAPLATTSFIIVAVAAEALTGKWRWARTALVVVALALVAFTFARGIKVLGQYKGFYDQTVNEIITAPRQAVLRERMFDGYSRFIKPVNFKSDNFFAHEVIYCAYFGKENVQFVNGSIYDRYHNGTLLDGAVPLTMKSDRPDISGAVLALSPMSHIAVELKTDTFPHSFQTARYYLTSTDALSSQELSRRQDYGLVTDYDPQGFFPLRYKGRIMLIMPMPTRAISHIVIPLGIEPGSLEVTLK